jgi:hypothetical protein
VSFRARLFVAVRAKFVVVLGDGRCAKLTANTTGARRGITVVREVLEKSIEELEGDAWGEPTYDSYVVTQSHLLRRKPLKDLSIENLRLLVGQEIGFPWVLELAIEQLERNRWAEGDFYEGDLLANVSRVKAATWSSHPELRARFGAIAERVRPRLLMEARSDPHGIEADILRNLARVMGWPVPGFLWHFPDPFRTRARKFPWGSDVRTRPGIPMEFRSCEQGWVYGCREVENESQAEASGFPVGTILYIVEFEGGDSLEIPEEYLASFDE